MSVYCKENADFLNRALVSIWDEQTLRPDEIVLVKDGALTVELDKTITEWQNKLGNVLKVVTLAQNVGLGDALNNGIQECSNELIARMDTDDIAHPERFEKQTAVFKEYDVDICSSNVDEFESDENVIISSRKVPEKHSDIVKFFKIRNGINHPASMYKKSAVLKAGGYRHMLWFEDYYLWVRMIINGAVFYNIQEPLVNMRAGYAQLERRGGLKYALAELAFMKELRNIGFLTLTEFYRNVILRFTARLMQKHFLRAIYKALRAK